MAAHNGMTAVCFASPDPLLASSAHLFHGHTCHGFLPDRRCSYRSRTGAVRAPPRTSRNVRTKPRMAATTAERALWAEALSNTYDGDTYQFRNISLIVPVGAKIALLGGNGVGKSSLLKALAGHLDFDSGRVSRKKGLSLAMVSQELPKSVDPNESVLQAVLRVAEDQTSSPSVRAALAYANAMAEMERGGSAVPEATVEALTKASAAMEREQDAWSVDSYLRNAVAKLHLPLDAKVVSLSGGQQRRLGLAAALVSKPDILLLDEPTNHLSLEGIEFLEEALCDPGLTTLVISHDRVFVDKFANDIWELDNGLHRYGGGYLNYLEAKAARLVQAQKDSANLARMYKKELAWVRKQPKARGTKAKARVDKFEAMEAKITEKKFTSEVQSLKTTAARLGGRVIDMKNVFLRRGSSLILDNFSYNFERGERVGANGVGKSSILKAILGQIAIDSGSIEVGETVVLGYFDQDGLVSEEEQAMRVLEYVSQVSSHVGGGYLASNGGTSSQGGGDFESKLDAQLERLSYSAAVPMQKSENPNPLAHLSPIQLLDQFGFGRQQQHAFISTLSGGERRRLQLLSLLVSNPNCMLLDEVSNDIDIRTLSMLEELLDAFSGTLVVVSHDRMLLDRLVNHLFIVEGDGTVSFVEGKFSEFRQAQREAELERRRVNQERNKTAVAHVKAVPSSSEVGQTKKLSFKERKEFECLEDEVMRAEAKHAELASRLETKAGRTDYSTLAEWTEEMARLQDEINTKGERWMELAERCDL